MKPCPKLYIETKSSSAGAFIDLLRQTLFEDRAPEIPTRFIFRGQGSSEWKLVPVAFRGGTILGYESRMYARIAGELPQATWDQGNAEMCALMEFLNLADKVGLDIPADHQWLRQWNPFHNVVGHDIGIAEWPPPALYEALAIAQHHGVPTRLLDFSQDPLVAAYLAASTPAEEAHEIAVWSVDLQFIKLAGSGGRGQIEIVSVPRPRNRNLAAQKALFVLDRSGFSTPTATLEASIAEHLRMATLGGLVERGRCAVRKFCLVKSQSDELLKLLIKLGIDRAHLMPSFDGVVTELESRRRLAKNQIPTVGSQE